MLIFQMRSFVINVVNYIHAGVPDQNYGTLDDVFLHK
jgi:hypothetical protein